MFLAAGPMVLLVNRTPDRLPAEVTVEQIERDRTAIQEKLDHEDISDMKNP